MKFGKLLRTTAEAQPEWADAYLDYKLLKKKLKALKRNDEEAGEKRRKKDGKEYMHACGNAERIRANRERQTTVRQGSRSRAVNEHQTLHVRNTEEETMREDETDEKRASTNTKWRTNHETEETNGGEVQLQENRATAVDARTESHKGAGSSQVRVRVSSL